MYLGWPRGETRANGAAGLKQFTLGGAGGDVQMPPDLGVRPSFDVVQDEDVSTTVREGGDGAFEIKHEVGCGWRRADLLELLGRDRDNWPRPQPLTRAVDGDGHQPRRQRRSPLEVGDPLRGAQPGLLNDVLGVGSPAGHQPERHRVHTRGVAAVEEAKGFLIAAIHEPRGQLLIRL